jgi:hypothetical protein
MRRVLLVVLIVGCTNDPVYLTSPNNMEAGMDDGMGNTVVAKSSLMLPIKPESSADLRADMALANRLGGGIMVPYVKLDDLDIEVEYTIKNLDGMPGKAKVELNGANEFFVFDPSQIVIGDPQEAPPTPGLAGDIPIDIPANGVYSDVFREDQLVEAAFDLDQVTRGNVNPFAAMLTVNKNQQSFQPMSTPMYMNPVCQQNPDDPTCVQTPVGNPVPRSAMAGIIRIDLVFKPDHHMVLDYTVRVRDHRNLLHDKGLAAPPNQIVMFMPATYAP